MKFKYYLRGFGTGVLFATIVCMIGMAINDNLAKNQKTHITSSGNVVTETKNDKLSENDYKEKETDTTETTIQNETTISNETTITNETTTGIDETSKIDVPDVTTENVTSGSIEENVNESGDTVTFVINSGMVSGDVARLLERSGVVENAYDFDTYMNENGYESKLKIGVYEIKKGASYNEIAEAITS